MSALFFVLVGRGREGEFERTGFQGEGVEDVGSGLGGRSAVKLEDGGELLADEGEAFGVGGEEQEEPGAVGPCREEGRPGARDLELGGVSIVWQRRGGEKKGAP
jgi:hypothetical protein